MFFEIELQNRTMRFVEMAHGSTDEMKTNLIKKSDEKAIFWES